MSDEIEALLAKKFIARRDAKAVQMSDGAFHLHTDDGSREGSRLPWRMGDLRAHVARKQTFGHYLLDTESRVKLFAFDIDLEKSGVVPVNPDWTEFRPLADLRAEWLSRKSPYRSWFKYQFHSLAHRLASVVVHDLGLPCAVAYSGGKGVHVYAFTGLMDAAEAREGASLVLERSRELNPGHGYKLVKGANFYKTEDQDPESGFGNLSIEVFPKQTSLDGKDLGNLMRLPLGRNMKSSDPTFFMDMRAPMGSMIQRDAMEALTNANPWQ